MKEEQIERLKEQIRKAKGKEKIREFKEREQKFQKKEKERKTKENVLAKKHAKISRDLMKNEEKKINDKKAKRTKRFNKIAGNIDRIITPKGKVVSRKVFKNDNLTARIENYKAPSVLNDPNKFFRGQVREEGDEILNLFFRKKTYL